MENRNDPMEFTLEDILNEFSDHPPQEEGPPPGEEPAAETEAAAEEPAAPVQEAPAPAEEPAVPEEGEAPRTDQDTLRFDLSQQPEDPLKEEDYQTLLADETVVLDLPEQAPEMPEAPEKPEGEMKEVTGHAAAESGEQVFVPTPKVYTPRSRLRELKKKLVSGPEKRYYELSEIGVGKLQLAILISVVIVALCAGITGMFLAGRVPENRLRLVIFSQVLAMLLSGLLGSQLMLDSVIALFKGRFTVNTLLTLTFVACAVDAVYCLKELRVPCCAAFSLSMTMALWARCQQRNTEMAQLDTMRKAVRLHGISQIPNYFDGKSAFLRTEGEVEDFMDTYDKPSAPEKVQSIYALIALLACGGIALFAGLRHGVGLGVQILSTSLLVAVPASFFVSLTRPMAILEQRLHMVGSVLCGWRGVRELSRKAVVPLEDEDLFPRGCTKLNGVKFYGDRNPDETVAYTTALITKAGGGLMPVFQQLLASRNGNRHPVLNFRNYGGGGIGGEVCGEPVLLGTLDFLQDMGVEIPEGTMVNQAVYAAVDGQLSAVYAISYAKMRSAAAGLVTLTGCRRLTTLMLGCDFMLTEEFLQAKFGIKTKRMAFPDGDVRAELRKIPADPESPVLAMTTREELISLAYAITGARALRTASNLGVAIHLVGGIAGMLIMLALAYLGGTQLLTPVHVLLYQLVWAIPGLLVTEWTRTV